MTSILLAVEAYYREQGILSTEFRCPHLAACNKKKSRDFVEACPTLVGEKYETAKPERTWPRLAFLSLDPGGIKGEYARAEYRTLQFTRQWENDLRERGHVEEDGVPIKHNRHWYQTHELAQELLNDWIPGITWEGACQYFAHVNVVKCCVNNQGNAQAPAYMYRACRGYLPGELAVLAPDVVVSQGAAARVAIQDLFAASYVERRHREYGFGAGKITVGERQILVIHTHHPRYGPYWRQRRECSLGWRALIQDQMPAASDSESVQRADSAV